MTRLESWEQNKYDLVTASAMAEVSPEIMARIAGFESQFDPSARPISQSKPWLNKYRQFDGVMAMSTAYGYGQFLDGTWHQMIQKYGAKYGVQNAAQLTKAQANSPELRKNTALQAGMLAEFTRENIERGAKLGGPDSDANVYAFHNLGAGDATRFLNALKADPDQRVDSVLSANVISGNNSLYDDGSRTVAESYRVMGNHMRRYDEYAIDAIELFAEFKGIPYSLPEIRPLRIGHRGFDVYRLQENLKQIGIETTSENLVLTKGEFDIKTQEAVQTFQRQHGLPVTGDADIATLAAIQAGARAIESVQTISQPGEQFRSAGYRTDWLDRDAKGLPNYLHAHASPRPHSGTVEPAAAERSPAHPPASARIPPHRSGPAHAPLYQTAPPSATESSTLPPLPTTQTLEPGDRGAAVQALQQHLQLLGATDRYGHQIQADRDYGDRTRDAVEQFQLWTGREPTGIADSETLQAIQAQTQFALRQRAQGIAIAPDAHLTERLRPARPDLADAAFERPVSGRSPWTPSNDPSPFPLPKRADHERSEAAPDRPRLDTQTFSTHHRDHVLFEAIRRQLPPGTSDDIAAHVMLQAKIGGVEHIGKLDEVIVQKGMVYVAGKTPGDMAAVDLSAPVPALQETLRQSAVFDQQQAVQLAQFQEQQRAISMPGGGPTMG